MTETETAIRVDQQRRDRDLIRSFIAYETNELVEQGLRDAASLIDPDEEGQADDRIVVSMTREDARELGLILDMDRQRMDKGDDRPVPQPRWGANVRVSKAVAAALDATREG